MPVTEVGPQAHNKLLNLHLLTAGPDLPLPIVEMAFEYASAYNVPLAAFLGDDTVTLKMHSELEVEISFACAMYFTLPIKALQCANMFKDHFCLTCQKK